MIAVVRLATAATVTAVGIALALAAQVSPASAAEQPAGALLSLDGVHFSAQPQGSLFPAGVVLIPGATADATIWVRNSSGAPADLRVAIAGATSSAAEFVESLTVSAATAATPARTPVPLSGGDCTAVLTGEVLSSGATTQVHIMLAMSPDSGNAGQGATADATLAVSLSEVADGVSLPPNCDATTGVPVMPSAARNSGGVADSVAATATTNTTTSGISEPATGDAGGSAAPGAPGASGATANNDAPALALPTLPFGREPALIPGVLAGLAVLAAGTVAFVLVLRKRRAQ